MCVKCVDMRIKWANIRGGSQMKQVWGGIREGDVERKSAKEGSKWKWREGKYKVKGGILFSKCVFSFFALARFCSYSQFLHNQNYFMSGS